MKRYDAVNTNGDPLYAPSPDGEMVFYSDVAALVAMNAELVEALGNILWDVCQDDEPDVSLTYLASASGVLRKAKELSHEG